MEENKVIPINKDTDNEEVVLNEETKLDEIAELLDNVGLNEDLGFDAFASMLALPDEQFNTMAPLLLEELEKSMNNPGDRIMLQQALREMGKTAQDFSKLQEEVLEELDEKLGDEIPKNKLDFLKRVMIITTNIFAEADGVAKSIISIPIELCGPEAKMPTYANDGDAAMDIYALEDTIIDPGETKLVKTGVKVAIPKGYALLIHPRSGQSLKTKLRVCNSIGLIDSKKEASQWAA